MRRRAGGDPKLTFSELLRGERHPAIQRNREDLREYADLRNAIVHRRTLRLLAEPTDEAVADIARIRQIIEEPPRIERAIGVRKVVTCRPGSSVLEATQQMVASNFSQLPVYDGRLFIALLTAETIARWVGARLQTLGGMLEDEPVNDALAYTEDADNIAFLAPAASVFDVLERFDEYSASGKSLDAILVTDKARRDAVPLNIATIYDVPAFISESRGK